MATSHAHKIRPGKIAVGTSPSLSTSSDRDIRWCSCTEGLRRICGRCRRFGSARTSSPWSSTTTGATDGLTVAPVSSMTWENLTADADALRQQLGFERWAVLGHSFGGHVALEYALRYPDSLSHLVLLDTGGDSRWARRTRPNSSPSAATARRRLSWSGAGSPASSHPRSTSRSSCGSGVPTTTARCLDSGPHTDAWRVALEDAARRRSSSPART